jgi:hypothetical protein
VDAGFLADQMNITVCEFPRGQWEQLPNWLNSLKEEIERPRARSSGWSFAVGPCPEAVTALQIARHAAPVAPLDGEAIAFVARRENGLPVPPKEFAHLTGEVPEPLSEHVFSYPGRRIYAVTARRGTEDDNSAVQQAAREFLETIAISDQSIATIHLHLSATGGTVPPIYGFMEVVRTFADWRVEQEARGGPRLRLVLHIESDVELMLTSGRVDVAELLTSKLLRFWAVVASAGNLEPVRRSLYYHSSTHLAEVLRELKVPPDSRNWFVSVCPSPRKETLRQAVCEVQDLTLTEVGLVFGSVLILESDACERDATKASS